jgi:hypothetical protein
MLPLVFRDSISPAHIVVGYLCERKSRTLLFYNEKTHQPIYYLEYCTGTRGACRCIALVERHSSEGN